MGNEVVAQAVRQFAQDVGRTVSETQSGAYIVHFRGERYPACIDVDVLGLSIGYATKFAALKNPSDPSAAPDLLLRIWCSVNNTGFYYSVNKEEGETCIYLETVQYLLPNTSPADIATILWMCWTQSRQAREAIHVSG